MQSLDTSKPTYLVVTGLPGVGKSFLTSGVAPVIASSVINEFDDYHPFYWLETSTTPPLQRLYAARTRVEGESKSDRQRYEILHTLLDVFTSSPLYGAPPFKILVRTVEDIMHFDTSNAKGFMRLSRNLIETLDPDALMKWCDRSIQDRFLAHQRDAQQDIEDLEQDQPDKAWRPKAFGVILPDITTAAEFEWFKAKENFLHLCLTCDEDIRLSRLSDDSGPEFAPFSRPDFTLDTSTKVERMLLDGDDLPYNEDDLRLGKKKARDRCVRRLKAEEFQDLVSQFRNLFQEDFHAQKDS